jgi:hypothetical protein
MGCIDKLSVSGHLHNNKIAQLKQGGTKMGKQFRILVGMLLAMVILATLTLTGCSSQTGSSMLEPTAQVANPIQAAAPVSSSNGAPQEGIKVHGSWTIEVRNPDGTLVSSRSFENSLQADGSYLLEQVLDRNATVGGWFIYLNKSTTSPFTPAPGFLIEQSANDPTGANIFPTLSISIAKSGFTLSGNATAQQSGDIGVVGTGMCDQVGLQTPAINYAAGLGTLNNFTEQTLATPISVQTGQQILVTVVISFS